MQRDHNRRIKLSTYLRKMGNRGVSRSSGGDGSSRRNGSFSTPLMLGFNGLGLGFEVGCSWKMVWGSLHMEKPHHNMAGTCSVCDASMFSRTDLADNVSHSTRDPISSNAQNHPLGTIWEREGGGRRGRGGEYMAMVEKERDERLNKIDLKKIYSK